MLFTVGDAAAAIGGALKGADPATPVTGVVIDSRATGPGDLFVALAGQNVDGHLFARDAAAKGAACVLVNPRRLPPGGDLPRIEVEQPLDALGRLAAWYRQRFQVPTIGVTGSVGKTTTKEMIAAVLGRRGPVLKSFGNYNNEIGVPLSTFAWRPEHQAAVFELAMRARGDIKLLTDMIKPTMGVMTKIGPTHLEVLGSMEAIAAAKAELIEALPPTGTAVLNADDPWVAAMAGQAPGRVVMYGTGSGAAVRGEDPRPDGRFAFTFQLTTPAGSGRVRVPSPGAHLMTNALAAAAVGWVMGLSLEETAKGLAAYKPAGPRLEIITLPGLTILDDSYNAAPVSVTASLGALAQAAGSGRAVAVLGDMLELGSLAQEGHAEVGRAAAGVARYLFCYGPLMAHAASAAREAGMPPENVRHYEDKERLTADLLALLRPGDTLLVKGSRSMDMGSIVNALRRDWRSR